MWLQVIKLASARREPRILGRSVVGLGYQKSTDFLETGGCLFYFFPIQNKNEKEVLKCRKTLQIRCQA